MMGAVATVLALIFSVALLVLSMVATLFGPRLLLLGRELMLDGVPTLIVGVMPPDFAFPVAGTELWVPLRDRAK